MTIKTLEKSLLKLDPIQRIHMVDRLLQSLDKPDLEIERAWGIESDKRFKAYKKNPAMAVTFAEFKKKIDKCK